MQEIHFFDNQEILFDPVQFKEELISLLKKFYRVFAVIGVAQVNNNIVVPGNINAFTRVATDAVVIGRCIGGIGCDQALVIILIVL